MICFFNWNVDTKGLYSLVESQTDCSVLNLVYTANKSTRVCGCVGWGCTPLVHRLKQPSPHTGGNLRRGRLRHTLYIFLVYDQWSPCAVVIGGARGKPPRSGVAGSSVAGRNGLCAISLIHLILNWFSSSLLVSLLILASDAHLGWISGTRRRHRSSMFFSLL